MITPFLSTLAFEPQLTTLAVLAILAVVFFRRVPTLLKWLLGFFFVVCLFPGDPVASGLGSMASTDAADRC